MKTKLPPFAVLAAAFVLFSASVNAGTFTIGTNQFEFAWEDTSLSTNVRARIDRMLLDTLVDWTNAPVDLATDGCSGSVQFWELGHPPFLARVGLPNMFASSGTNGSFAISVPEPFSDACKDAFAWCDAHPEHFASGRRFVATLSALAEDSGGTNNLASSFYSPDIPEETMSSARESLLEVLRGKCYRFPVELSFGVWAGDDDVPDGTPVMLIPFQEASIGTSGSSSDRNDAMPALFIDGQWRIYLWKP